MPQHPGLTTERLFLRQLELRDSNAIFAAYAYDLEVTRFLSCKPHSKKTEPKA